MVRIVSSGLFAVSLLIHGCARAEAPDSLPAPAQAAAAAPEAKPEVKSLGSLDRASAAKTTRKVIRNAEMTLEANDEPLVEQKLTALAERLGGFTVSSERHQYTEGEGESFLTIDVTVRVPAEKFQEFLDQARGFAVRVSGETTSGQDVTEEFIDLEARVRTERALEAQYLEILKEAKNVKDALEVHARLGEVREQIEKAEGRRRFLESQTELSTVKVSIRKFVPAIRTGGFGMARSVRRAASDVVEVSVALLSGSIRVIGVLLPIAVILGLPAFYLVRLMRARRRRRLIVEEVSSLKSE